jgi:hypothetical protein
MHFNKSYQVIEMKKIKKKVNRRGDHLVCGRHGQFRLPGRVRNRERETSKRKIVKFMKNQNL